MMPVICPSPTELANVTVKYPWDDEKWAGELLKTKNLEEAEEAKGVVEEEVKGVEGEGEVEAGSLRDLLKKPEEADKTEVDSVRGPPNTPERDPEMDINHFFATPPEQHLHQDLLEQMREQELKEEQDHREG